MMKKLMRVLLGLAALSAALCLTAAAAEVSEGPVKVWGKVSPWEGEGLLLVNGDEADPFREVVIHTGDAPVVDAATGLPLDLEKVKEGDVLYAWAGPAAMLSQPPQMTALVVVGNVPTDGEAPEYCEIAGAAVLPGGGEGGARFPLTGGGTLEVTEKTAYSPWLTRQIVRQEDLQPGTRVLVWKDKEGRAEKVLVFAYPYESYLTVVAKDGGETLVCVNGGADDKTPQAPCKKTEDGIIMAPIRAVAEASGYQVHWDKSRGAVVEDSGKNVVFYAVPGEQVIFRDGEKVGIAAPCIYEKGTTYLPLEDLAYWLDLFVVK